MNFRKSRYLDQLVSFLARSKHWLMSVYLYIYLSIKRLNKFKLLFKSLSFHINIYLTIFRIHQKFLFLIFDQIQSLMATYIANLPDFSIFQFTIPRVLRFINRQFQNSSFPFSGLNDLIMKGCMQLALDQINFNEFLRYIKEYCPVN